MLPFFKAKSNQSGVIVKDRQNQEMPEEETTSHEIEELEECVKDLMVAISFKDIKRIAESIKDIHDVLHVYMDQEDKNSTNYALQNARAYNPEQE